jgi:hypothetical protein
MKSRFHLLLDGKIQEAVERMVESLVEGGASDYPKYKEIVGYVRGLKDALKYCEEIETENT